MTPAEMQKLMSRKNIERVRHERQDGGPGSGPHKGGYADAKKKAEEASAKAKSSGKAEDHDKAADAHIAAGKEFNQTSENQRGGSRAQKAQGGHVGAAQDHVMAAKMIRSGSKSEPTGYEGISKRMNLK